MHRTNSLKPCSTKGRLKKERLNVEALCMRYSEVRIRDRLLHVETSSMKVAGRNSKKQSNDGQAESAEDIETSCMSFVANHDAQLPEEEVTGKFASTPVCRPSQKTGQAQDGSAPKFPQCRHTRTHAHTRIANLRQPRPRPPSPQRKEFQSA